MEKISIVDRQLITISILVSSIISMLLSYSSVIKIIDTILAFKIMDHFLVALLLIIDHIIIISLFAWIIDAFNSDIIRDHKAIIPVTFVISSIIIASFIIGIVNNNQIIGLYITAFSAFLMTWEIIYFLMIDLSIGDSQLIKGIIIKSIFVINLLLLYAVYF